MRISIFRAIFTMLSRLNLKSFYIIGYPTVFSFSVQGMYKYLPPNFYYMLIGGLVLGAGVVIWWRLAKHLLFALEIKIEFKNEDK